MDGLLIGSIDPCSKIEHRRLVHCPPPPPPPPTTPHPSSPTTPTPYCVTDFIYTQYLKKFALHPLYLKRASSPMPIPNICTFHTSFDVRSSSAYLRADVVQSEEGCYYELNDRNNRGHKHQPLKRFFFCNHIFLELYGTISRLLRLM